MAQFGELLGRDPIPHLTPNVVRSTRFTGESQRCLLANLQPGSRSALEGLYQWLNAMAAFATSDRLDPQQLSDLQALVGEDRLAAASGWARQLSPIVATTRMTRILHDVRGGALHQLICLASCHDGHLTPRELAAIATLARDHAKVVRHSVLGLDESRRMMDGASRRHGVDNLRRRLDGLMLAGPEGPVSIAFTAGWEGDFASTCPEFSTVLKQVYHLVGNASRHASDGRVSVGVFPKPTTEPAAVRIAVGNAIDPEQQARLAAPDSPVWRGFSTTGSGVGLASAAELVSEAFGLGDPEAAITQRLVGHQVTDGAFVAWLHWPLLDTALTDAVGPPGGGIASGEGRR